MPIPNSIAAMADDLAEWRRDLHRHPELSREEKRTAATVAAKLREFGFDDVTEGIGGHGVVGTLKGRKPGSGTERDSILLRADMDALPITEATAAEHASTNEGVMHACGHDGHTTMLLGAARHLAETRNFEGTVHFCFQPAEEDGSGAKAMIDDGLFDRFPARAVFGMHNWPGLPVGELAVRPGPMMAASGIFDMRVVGKGGHGALPHKARDPIAAGAQLVTALQTLVSRRLDPLEPAVVSVTRFEAGTTYNVIPDEARICGTVRCFSDAVADQIREEMHRIAGDVARGMSVEVVFDIEPICHPATVNDAEAAAFAGDVMARVVGEDRAHRDFPPTCGAEDFAFMSMERPGAFIFIGNGDSAPLHNAGYDFDDDAAPVGAAFWSQLVEDALPVN